MKFYYRIFYSRKNIRKFKLLPENSQAYLRLKNRPLIKHSVRSILPAKQLYSSSSSSIGHVDQAVKLGRDRRKRTTAKFNPFAVDRK